MNATHGRASRGVFLWGGPSLGEPALAPGGQTSTALREGLPQSAGVRVRRNACCDTTGTDEAAFLIADDRIAEDDRTGFLEPERNLVSALG